MWRVCKCLGIWNVGKFIPVQLFDVDLEAHDPVLSEILVGLGTRWDVCYVSLRAGLVFEEGLQWVAFDRLPAEQRIRTGQYLGKAKEGFTCLIGRMAKLVLEKLGSL